MDNLFLPLSLLHGLKGQNQNICACIDLSTDPSIESEARELAEEKINPKGSKKIIKWLSDYSIRKYWCCGPSILGDVITSGGRLITVPKTEAELLSGKRSRMDFHHWLLLNRLLEGLVIKKDSKSPFYIFYKTKTGKWTWENS